MIKFLDNAAREAWSGLKNFFGIQYLMSFGETTMARIVTDGTRANLVVDGNVIATYARARDARRGAVRRGLTVA